MASTLKEFLSTTMPDLCGIFPPIAVIIAEYARANPPPVITPSKPSFKKPKALCMNAEHTRLFVTDNELHCVFCFDLDGTLINSFSSSSESANQSKHGKQKPSPSGIVFIDGELFVANTARQEIAVFDPNGTFKRYWSTPSAPEGLAYSGDSAELFVTFNSESAVRVYSLDGTLRRSFSASDPSTTMIYEPTGIAYYQGHVYVCNWGTSLVSVFKSDGRFIRQWVCGYCNYVSIHRDQVLITDSPSSCIVVYSLEGKLLRKIGSRGTAVDQYAWPTGVLATDEWVFVADTNNQRVTTIRRESV